MEGDAPKYICKNILSGSAYNGSKSKRNFKMNYVKQLFTPIAFTFLCFTMFTMGAKAQNGQALFRQHCGICHTIGLGRLVGPDLNGVNTLRSEEWLLKWTKNSQEFIKSGDPDAKAIFAQFNNLVMPVPPISEPDIKEIYKFITLKSVAAAENKIATDASAPDENSISWTSPFTYLFLVVLIIVFFSVRVILDANRILKEESIKTTNFILNADFGRLFKELTIYQSHLAIQIFVIVLLLILFFLTIYLF